MTTHGPTYETKRVNRRGGLMHWHAAQWHKIGPVVRVREIRADGTTGKWELAAIALDPTRYIRATAGKIDVGVPR